MSLQPAEWMTGISSSEEESMENYNLDPQFVTFMD